ncbi:MAG: hypothetical protein WDO71_06185 [Bacteroidota bacterium]
MKGIKESYCKGACEQNETPLRYNYRVLEAIYSLQTKPSFAIIEEGLNADEQSCILVIKGKFYGMGYISTEVQVTDLETLQNLLTPYKENNYISNLINSYALKYPGKVRILENETVQSSH